MKQVHAHNHHTCDRKDRGQKLTRVLPGQCIGLFPNITCIEDMGSDADIGRADVWDVVGHSDCRAIAVPAVAASISHVCASAGERNTITNG